MIKSVEKSPPDDAVSPRDSVGDMGPGAVLTYLAAWAVFIAVVLILYSANTWHIRDNWVALGVSRLIPVGVPISGALGGLTVAAVQLATYWRKYDESKSAEGRSYNAWYLIRPPLGLVAGTFGALIAICVVGIVAPVASGQIGVSETGVISVSIIAFITGYKQDVFRKLLDKAEASLLGIGSSNNTATLFSLQPPVVVFSQVTVGETSSPSAVNVTNQGVTVLKLDTTTVSVTNSAFSLSDLPVSIDPGSTGSFSVLFSPTGASVGSVAGELVVAIDGTSAEIGLKGLGVAP